MIAIKGTTGGYTASTDATLSGLALEDGDGNETIDLTPAFDADDYRPTTASVVNGIDAVTLTATKNDSNATVAITGDTTTTTPDEAELSLNVGSNTLTVTVTAEDGTNPEDLHDHGDAGRCPDPDRDHAREQHGQDEFGQQ